MTQTIDFKSHQKVDVRASVRPALPPKSAKNGRLMKDPFKGAPGTTRASGVNNNSPSFFPPNHRHSVQNGLVAKVNNKPSLSKTNSAQKLMRDSKHHESMQMDFEMGDIEVENGLTRKRTSQRGSMSDLNRLNYQLQGNEMQKLENYENLKKRHLESIGHQ